MSDCMICKPHQILGSSEQGLAVHVAHQSLCGENWTKEAIWKI